MKRTIHQGFTLIEVVISFLLISFLVVMVSISITSTYKLSTNVIDLPNIYQTGQKGVEEQVKKVKDLIREKTRLENELKSEANPTASSKLNQQLTNILKQIDDLKKEGAPARLHEKTVNLFGQNVSVYEFQYRAEDKNDNTMINLYAGLANDEPLERPTAIIDKVEIQVTGDANTEEVFDAVGKTATATVHFNNSNPIAANAKGNTNTYQWYISTSNFHMLPDSNLTSEQAGKLGNTVMPVYASSFTPIKNATNKSIQIQQEYAGKFLICVVNNISKNGAISKDGVSNFLYINPLPKLTTGEYTMWIEPSLEKITYTDSGFSNIEKLESHKERGKNLPYSLVNRQGNPRIDLVGTYTHSHNDDPIRNASRYLDLKRGSYLYVNGGALSTQQAQAYIVAKNANNLTSPTETLMNAPGSSKEINFREHTKKGQGGDNGWRILVNDITGFGGATIGSNTTDIEVAEIIFTTNATQDEQENIIKYLSDKYKIK